MAENIGLKMELGIETVTERLKRFEILAGLSYREKTVEIWFEKFKEEYDTNRFNWICDIIEDKIRYNALPVFRDFLDSDPCPLHPGTNIPEKYYLKDVYKFL